MSICYGVGWVHLRDGMFVLDAQFAGVFVDDGDCDFDGVVGEQGFDAFGPLHKAWVA